MERLQRILAHAGVASRRAAEEMIRAGRVSVDGVVVNEMGAKADPTRSVIRVDGKPVRRQPPRYILLNKPRGYITTTNDERDRRTVLDLVQVKQRVYPVGRLDRDTEGLLLLTNDGEIANRVMHPRFGLAKEYHVLTLQRPSDTVLQRLRDGVTVDGKVVVPDEVRLLREERAGLWLRVVLHEGITHVVRRMMETAGIPVERLRRVRIGPLTVSGIPVGAWRELTPGELAGLVEALKLDRSVGERERGPRREKTIHKQRPQPRRRPSPPVGQTAPEAVTQPPVSMPHAAAAGRRGRGRPGAAEPKTPSDEAPPTAAPEQRKTNSRRRRGEPPAPAPRRTKEKHAARKAQRRTAQPGGKATKGPAGTGPARTKATPPGGHRRSPEPATPPHVPPQSKQHRRGPAPDQETRSDYDDPSRRRNRRARAREEAKSVSRRDRD